MASFVPFPAFPPPLTKPVPRSVIAHGERDIFAFFGQDFGENKAALQFADKAIGVLDVAPPTNNGWKVAGGTPLRKQMYLKTLKYTRTVLEDFAERVLYTVACMESGLTAPPAFANIDHIPDNNLLDEKLKHEAKLEHIRDGIKYIQHERSRMSEGYYMPSVGYQTIKVQPTPDELEAISYQVPKTNIDITKLKIKLRAERAMKNRLIGEIRQDQCVALRSYFDEASQILANIHAISQRLEQLSSAMELDITHFDADPMDCDVPLATTVKCNEQCGNEEDYWEDL